MHAGFHFQVCVYSGHGYTICACTCATLVNAVGTVGLHRRTIRNTGSQESEISPVILLAELKTVESSDAIAYQFIYVCIYLLYKSRAKSQNRNTNHACTDNDTIIRCMVVWRSDSARLELDQQS